MSTSPGGSPPRSAEPSLGSITIYDETRAPAESTTEYWALGRPRLLDTKETRVLADLISVYHDFDMAVTCLNRLIAAHGADHTAEDAILEHAMWITAVVHYTRCFSSGQRQRVLTRATILRELPNQVDLHDWLMALRNKHIAHDESAAWQFRPTVSLWELSDGHRIAQTSSTLEALISVKGELALMLRDHMKAVGDLLTPRLEKARRRCSEAIAKLPFDELPRLPEVELTVSSALDSVSPRREARPPVKRRRR